MRLETAKQVMIIFQDDKVYFRRLKYVLMEQIEEARIGTTRPGDIDSLVFVTRDNVSHVIKPRLLNCIRQIQHNIHVASVLVTENSNVEHLEKLMITYRSLPFAVDVDQEKSPQKGDYAKGSNEQSRVMVALTKTPDIPFRYSASFPSPVEGVLPLKNEIEMNDALQIPEQPQDPAVQVEIRGEARNTQRTISELQSIDQEIQQLRVQKELPTISFASGFTRYTSE